MVENLHSHIIGRVASFQKQMLKLFPMRLLNKLQAKVKNCPEAMTTTLFGFASSPAFFDLICMHLIFLFDARQPKVTERHELCSKMLFRSLMQLILMFHENANDQHTVSRTNIDSAEKNLFISLHPSIRQFINRSCYDKSVTFV